MGEETVMVYCIPETRFSSCAETQSGAILLSMMTIITVIQITVFFMAFYHERLSM